MTISMTKNCHKCKTEKPLDDFYLDRKNKKDGRQHDCKKCQSVRSQSESYRKSRQAYRKQYSRSSQRLANDLKNNYGTTLEQYQEMIRIQNGVCAICQKPESSKRVSRLSVDHCHKTKAIRGLLCLSCNAGLGKLGESPTLLRKAASYLEVGFTA